MKRCSKCGAEKARDEFSTRPGGYLQAWCKQCMREHQARRRAEDPSLGEQERARKKAEWQAYKRLAMRYPGVFSRLFNEELRRMGLEHTAEWRESRNRR